MEEGGFVYDSDVYNDDLPYYVQVKGKRHLIVPYSFTYNDGKFGLLPGYGGPCDFLDNLKRGFDELWREGETHPKMMSIGLHPRLIGQASRINALREFIEYALGKGQVLFTRRIDIADWWNAHHTEFSDDAVRARRCQATLDRIDEIQRQDSRASSRVDRDGAMRAAAAADAARREGTLARPASWHAGRGQGQHRHRRRSHRLRVGRCSPTGCRTPTRRWSSDCARPGRS